MPLQPAPGAVPITGTEVVARAVPQTRALLDALENPMAVTSASIERGRDRFEIYCRPCHGSEGRGDGPIAPKLANAVRDLTSETVRRASDGWIYGVMTGGFGALMPEQGSKLRSEDRWNIVNYVRVLQGASQ